MLCYVNSSVQSEFKMNGMGTLRTRFRGVKKELLDRQTSLIIQSMTVCILLIQ